MVVGDRDGRGPLQAAAGRPDVAQALERLELPAAGDLLAVAHSVLPKGAAGPLPVALTFDDGPWPNSTAQLLTILTQHKAPATFLVVGRQVQRYPDLVRGELAAGMAIGSHPYRHPSPSTNSRRPTSATRSPKPDAACSRGDPPDGFRPPGGAGTHRP